MKEFKQLQESKKDDDLILLKSTLRQKNANLKTLT